jgi:hypothetical protein
MQGENLAPAILSGKRGPDSAFFQIFGPFAGDGTSDGWRGVRTGQHMYARYKDKPWVLYDLEKDPFERNNLAGYPSAKSVQGEMERRLARWMEKTGDSWSYNWSHPVEDAGRLYRYETFYTVSEYLDWAKKHPDLDRAPRG